ncbi:MAG: NAD-dependent epimerase/dehydratase family protein [Gemmatimonadota bacterium]
MNVLVTGGAGFIGSHVAEGYLARGDDVWVVDDLSSGKEANVPEGATFVRMAIEDPGLARLFSQVGFDLVNHHAAQINVRVSVADPAKDARTNVLGLLNVLEAVRRQGRGRVIFISSGGVVYGEPEEVPTPETAPKLPLSPYGVTKLAGEFYLQYYRRVHGLDYIALRYSNVYGPRQDPDGEAGVVAIFSTRLLAGEELHIYGDGEQTRDYVYVGDLVRANLMASDLPIFSEGGLDDLAFNVGTSLATNVLTLANVLEEVSGLQSGRSFQPARDGELRHSTLNTSKLRSLGWTPQVGLHDGLGETFRWIAAREGAKKGGAR